MKYLISNIEELNMVVDDLIPMLQKNTYLLMSGNLGAGKTTLTKAILKKMGVKEVVTSPTFVILNQYELPNLLINHMDAYRLEKTSELDEFTEQFGGALNIIEWYENLNLDFDKLDAIYLTINLKDEMREILITGGKIND